MKSFHCPSPVCDQGLKYVSFCFSFLFLCLLLTSSVLLVLHYKAKKTWGERTAGKHRGVAEDISWKCWQGIDSKPTACSYKFNISGFLYSSKLSISSLCLSVYVSFLLCIFIFFPFCCTGCNNPEICHLPLPHSQCCSPHVPLIVCTVNKWTLQICSEYTKFGSKLCFDFEVYCLFWSFPPFPSDVVCLDTICVLICRLSKVTAR